MPGPVFQKLNVSDQNLNRVQDNVAKALAPLTSNDLLNRRLLTNISLASGDNKVAHGLGRPLKGWSVVRQRASATIYDKQDANTTPDLTLTLNASGAVVVDLEVF